MSLISVLSSLATSLPTRVLGALGIGVISFSGISLAADSLISTIQSNWGGIPADVLSVISLAGFPTGFGIILGAIIARVSLGALSKLGRIPTS